MMHNQTESREELINELKELRQANQRLQASLEQGVKQRQVLEDMLEESQNEYRLLSLNSAEVIWTLDWDYQFTFISPAIKQLRGLMPEQAVCEPLLETMPVHSQKLVRVALEQCRAYEDAEPQVPLRIEFEQYHKGGHLIWVEAYIKVLRNDDGDRIGFVGNSRDITHRKKVEKSMAEAVERFETLVAKVPVGIYIVGLQGNGDPRFEYVSDRWCEIHQIPRDEVMHTMSRVNRLIHPEDIEDFLLKNTESIRGRKNFLWEGRVLVGGRQRWFRIQSVPISYAHGESQWFGVSQDITERKQVENALRESEIQLRELNAQKDKFFSIIAHDLISPFNAILGFSQLLVSQIEEGDFENIDEYAEMIERSSQQAVDLLTNLLEWSRAQTGRMEFNPTILELHALISENKELFDIIAGQKSIRIDTKLAGEMFVFADKQMISTVLRNLTSNAIKFTKPGGQITLSARKSEGEILLSVRDTGVGISADRLEKLFRIDESESTLGTNQEVGTGLGLILCQEFVAKHGGKIWAESEAGKGSTFYFTLPCRAP